YIAEQGQLRHEFALSGAHNIAEKAGEVGHLAIQKAGEVGRALFSFVKPENLNNKINYASGALMLLATENSSEFKIDGPLIIGGFGGISGLGAGLISGHEKHRLFNSAEKIFTASAFLFAGISIPDPTIKVGFIAHGLGRYGAFLATTFTFRRPHDGGHGGH
ncbi:MAG: hypothetical protein WCJ19_03730, partial [bacterium]